MAEISIYHQPGPFIYTVWDKDGNPLYVGGTRDIMAKSFKFNFEFSDITGEYWAFPGNTFESAIDEKIAKLRPRYNSHLRTSSTKKQIIKYFKEFFGSHNLKFTKEIRELIVEYLSDEEGITFNGEIYYTLDTRGYIEEIIREQYGIHGFKS